MPEPEDTIVSVLNDGSVQIALEARVEALWALGRKPEIISAGFQDNLVKEVPLKNAIESTGVVVVTGYLDEVNNPGFSRLYTSLDLTDYIDVPSAEVVLRVDLRTPFDPLAGQAIWIKRGADILQGSRGVQKYPLQGDFLSGGMSSAGAGARGYPGAASPGPWCSGARGYPGAASPGPWCSGRGYPGAASPSPWCAG